MSVIKPIIRLASALLSYLISALNLSVTASCSRTTC